jgi:hypothetical protein
VAHGDDDFLPGLPPADGGLDDETPAVEDDVELDVGEEEGVGLDATTGGEEPLDAELTAELLDGLEDEQRWTVGSEEAGDEAGSHGIEETDQQSEYGWTEGSETDERAEWEDDGLEVEEPPGSVLDDGSEGVEEHFAIDGDEDALPGLPALDREAERNAEEAASDLDLEADGGIEGPDLSFDEEARIAGDSLPPPIDLAAVESSYLGPSEPLHAIAVDGDALLAGGASLHRFAGSGRRELEIDAAAEQGIASIAVAGATVLVGTRVGELFRAKDGGDFEPVALPLDEEVHPLTVVVEPGSGRLWAHAGRQLLVSDDLGETFGRSGLDPVRALAIDPEGGLAAVAGPDAGPVFARHRDGGWERHPIERLPGAADLLAVLGETVAIASDDDASGPRVSRDGGRSFAPLPSLPRPTALVLARENGAAVLYAALYFEGQDRGVVIRHPLDAPPALVLDVPVERRRHGLEPSGDAEGDHRVAALAARPDAGGTLLHVATGLGLFRLRVKLG